MKLYLLLILFIATGFNVVAKVEPIAASDIFATPDIDDFQFSPNSTFISHVQRTEKGQSILVASPISFETLYTIPLDKRLRLLSYQWLNEKALYLTMKGDGKGYQIVAKINDKTNKFEYFRINANGALVDRLEDEPAQVMYQKASTKYDNVFDLYKITIDDLLQHNFSKAQLLAQGNPKLRNFFYDVEFERIIALEGDEKTKSVAVKYADISDGKWRKGITLTNEDYFFLPVGFADENSIAVITNKDTDKKSLRLFDIKNQELSEVVSQHPHYDLLSAKYSSNGKLDWVSYMQHGLLRYHYFDNENIDFHEHLKNKFADKEIYVVDRNRDSSMKILYANGSDEPGHFYLYKPATNEIASLGAAFKKLENKQFIRSKPLIVETEDGVNIEAFLTLPEDASRSVLLVMPHGGPINVQDNDRFNAEVQYLASRGFAILRVNFRGSAGYGKSFMDQGVGQFGKLIERDITAVVKKVSEEHSFNHYCAMGNSYGGYSATMLAIIHPSQYQCVIAGFGVYDLTLLFNASNFRSGEEYKKLIERTVGSYSDNLKEVSPVYLAHRLKSPIMLFGGKEDDIADFEHTNRLHYVLQRQNHPVEIFHYEKTGHGHPDWWGERHEAAAKVDYLSRTLSLKDIDTVSFSESAKLALAEDKLILADGFYHVDRIEHNAKKGFDYFSQAAELGDKRALFNVASFYQRGEIVDKTASQAEIFYQKSAERGYANAHLRLGQLYLDGIFLQRDFAKAKHHLLEAIRLAEEPAEATLYLARWYCLSPDEKKSIEECIKHLEEYAPNKNNDVASLFKASLAASFIDGIHTDAERIKLSRFVTEKYNLTHKFSGFSSIESGTFRKAKNGFKQTDDSAVIHARGNKSRFFGVVFEADIKGMDSGRDSLGILFRWVQRDKAENIIYVEHNLLYGSPLGDWSIMQATDQPESEWTLEVYDLELKLLHREIFRIRASESSLASEISASQ